MTRRSSGVLMHITSLPGEFGIGTFGKSAYNFVDFLEETKQTYWQILPLTTTSYGDSPYQSFSAVAGNLNLIDFSLLKEAGLLDETDYSTVDFGSNPEKIDYALLFEARRPILEKAVANTIKSNEVNSRIGNLDNKVKLSSFLSTNIFKNSNFNSFSQNVKGFSGKIFNIYGGYYNQNYTFDIDRKIKGDKISSNMYNIGIEKDFKISNTKLNTSFDFSFINTNLNRKINGDEVTSNFNSLLFNIGNILIHDMNIWKNKLSLFATHNTSILKLNDIEEKSNKEELKDYITKVKSKTYVKTTLGIGANINSPITNNISLLNSCNLNFQK